MSTTTPPPGSPASAGSTGSTGPVLLPPLSLLKIHRGQLVAVSVIGLILGIIALFWPGATLLTVAIVFGIYLIASGIFRINSAFVADRLSVGLRWATGLLGVLVVVTGILCLADPFRSVVVLAYVIGIGWIAEGIVDLMAGVQGSVHPRWFGFVSGILSILAGIVTFVLPAVAIVTFVTIGAWLLIVVSVSTLLMLPRKAKEPKTPKASRVR